ncbi:MAG: DUF6049 family protein [Agromyces sp.]
MPAGRLRALRRAAIGFLALGTMALGPWNTSIAAANSSDIAVTAAAAQPLIPPATAATIMVEVLNDSAIATGAGTVEVSRSTTVLATATTIEQWRSGIGRAGRVIGSTQTLSTPANGSTSVSVVIPPGELSTEGVWGIEATVTIGSARYAARTVVNVRSTPIQAEVTPIVAIAPQSPTTGLWDSATLGELTAPKGELTEALAAVSGQNVVVGIDPRIFRSIDALGATAPASALEWRQRFESERFETFLLQFADADPSLQSQLGLATLLGPGEVTDLSSASNAGSTGSEWRATRTLLWPAPASVVSSDLDVFRASGYPQVILSSDNVADSQQPLVAIGDSTAIISEHSISAALSRALATQSTIAWQDSVNVLQAELSTRNGARVVLAADRLSLAKPGRVRDTLALLSNSSVSKFSPLSALSLQGATTIVDCPEPADRIATGRHVLERSAIVNQYANVADTPAVLTDRLRRDVLAVFGTGWFGQTDAWTSVVGGFDAAVNTTLNSVRIASSSTINVLSSEASVPITVENDLSEPIHVWVRVAPSNGRLVVGEAVEAEIPSGSRQTVRIPVKARIGSGSVALNVSLLDRNGALIGETVVIPANVQADWEGWGAGVLALTGGALFVAGIWRQVRRTRRNQAGASHGQS